KCGLQLIEAGDGAVLVANVLLPPAIAAQQACALGDVRVAGEDGAGIAQGAQVLGWGEAERRGLAGGANQLTARAGAVGLGAVLDELELERLRPRAEGCNVRGLAIQVYHQHGAGAGRSAQLKFGRVDAMRHRIDVAEDGSGASGDDRGYGWHASVGRHQHLIARLDTYGAERNGDRVRA